jgi:probable F420-dependent oxidoreductase
VPRISLNLSNVLFAGATHRLVEVAVAAERAGVDEVSIGDHVVLTSDLSGHPAGEYPGSADEPWPEPLTVLAAIATATSTIGLATAVLIAPLRPAPLLAKQVATVDALSRGRVALGVSASWSPGEYAAVGIPFAERGRRLTDTIAACRALWESAAATHESPTVSFSEARCSPRPVQDRIPVRFAGPYSRRLHDRVVALGDGWLPFMEDHDAVRSGVDRLRAGLAEVGRDPDRLDVTGLVWPVDDDGYLTPPGDLADLGRSLEAVPEMLDSGVTTLGVGLHYFVDDLDAAGDFCRELVKRVRP